MQPTTVELVLDGEHWHRAVLPCAHGVAVWSIDVRNDAGPPGCGCAWALRVNDTMLLARRVGARWEAERAFAGAGTGDHALEHMRLSDWSVEVQPCALHAKTAARVVVETRPSVAAAGYAWSGSTEIDLASTDIPPAVLGGRTLVYLRDWVSVARP